MSTIIVKTIAGTSPRKIFEAAVATFGETNQKVVAIEELSELQKEICKDLRGDGNAAHVAEEIADVSIMLDQLLLMYGNTGDAYEIRRRKLERLEKRIEEEANRRLEEKIKDAKAIYRQRNPRMIYRGDDTDGR